LGEYYRGWRDALRVPCTICAARGLPHCEVLGDIETQPEERAFELAFARTGKRVVVDTSKDLDWVRLFSAEEDLDIRIVHLVRDPRGFVASVRRRGPVGIDGLIDEWRKENEGLRHFVVASGLKSITANYDGLAQLPETEFPRLFEFCGMEFTKENLSYWNIEHHGFAANGASDALLKGNRYGHVPGHFRTADAEFYAQKSQTLFHDLRWRTAITADESAAIEKKPEVRGLLRSLGFAFTEEGMKTLPGADFSADT